MKHRAFAAALGALAALHSCCRRALLGLRRRSHPAFGPSRMMARSKMEVIEMRPAAFAAKIVWLKDPNDSKGKPLHDIRNEDPSMRDRPIVGLTALRGHACRARLGRLDRQGLQSRGGPDLCGARSPDIAHADQAQGLQGLAAVRREAVARTSAPPAAVPGRPAKASQIEAAAPAGPAAARCSVERATADRGQGRVAPAPACADGRRRAMDHARRRAPCDMASDAAPPNGFGCRQSMPKPADAIAEAAARARRR